MTKRSRPKGQAVSMDSMLRQCSAFMWRCRPGNFVLSFLYLSPRPDHHQNISVTIELPNVTSSVVDIDIAAYYVLLHQKVALAIITQLKASNSSAGTCWRGSLSWLQLSVFLPSKAWGSACQELSTTCQNWLGITINCVARPRHFKVSIPTSITALACVMLATKKLILVLKIKT